MNFTFPGLQPVTNFSGDHPFDLAKKDPILAHRRSLGNILKREPYLALSFLFLLCRAFIYFSPEIWSKVKAYWVSHLAHPKFAVLGGWSHFLERVPLMVDLKRQLTKLKISKKRNFQRGASNARAWASSLASSVSLSEAGSSRSVSSSSSSGSLGSFM